MLFTMRWLRKATMVGLTILGAGTAQAQVPGQPFGGGVPDLKHGALLFHGNYCGPGSRGPGRPAVDALDLACMHHDRCSPGFDSGRLPACSCNQRLQTEAAAVASDPAQPDDLRELAQTVSAGATLLPCQPGR